MRPDTRPIAGMPVLCADSVQSAATAVLGNVDAGFVCGLNAEVLAWCRRSAEFRQIIGHAVIHYADGISVVWGIRRRGGDTARIPGVELWLAVLRGLRDRGRRRVVLVGSTSEVLSRAGDRLAKEEDCRPVLSINGYSEAEDIDRLVERVADAGPDLVIVAMGVPRQERVIDRLVDAAPGAILMNVGGSLDVYAGLKQRAPRWMRDWHLEWLYRLVREPRRFGRLLASWSALLRLLRPRQD